MKPDSSRKATCPQPRAEVGDGGVGPQPPPHALQQPQPPGVTVPLSFEAREVAIGGAGVDAD